MLVAPSLLGPACVIVHLVGRMHVLVSPPSAETREGWFNQADALELADLIYMLVAQVHVAVVHCHVVLAAFTQDIPAQSYTASYVSWVPVSLSLSLLCLGGPGGLLFLAAGWAADRGG
jgi:hypothetical protein